MSTEAPWIKNLDFVKKMCLLVLLASAETYATAATVKIVAEGPALANAKMTEIERSGATYLGRHLAGFVGDSLELDKGVHHISLDGPKNYKFDFSISVGAQNVTVGDVSIGPKNCEPELKAAWAGPKVTVNKKGAVTLILAAPQFGPPTGESACAGPIIVPCERRSVALEVQTSPPGAEIWIDGHKQSMRTNHLVETQLEVCNNQVDVLLRLPGKTNCTRKVPLSGTAPARIACTFAKGIAQ